MGFDVIYQRSCYLLLLEAKSEFEASDFGCMFLGFHLYGFNFSFRLMSCELNGSITLLWDQGFDLALIFYS